MRRHFAWYQHLALLLLGFSHNVLQWLVAEVTSGNSLGNLVWDSTFKLCGRALFQLFLYRNSKRVKSLNCLLLLGDGGGLSKKVVLEFRVDRESFNDFVWTERIQTEHSATQSLVELEVQSRLAALWHRCIQSKCYSVEDAINLHKGLELNLSLVHLHSSHTPFQKILTAGHNTCNCAWIILALTSLEGTSSPSFFSNDLGKSILSLIKNKMSYRGNACYFFSTDASTSVCWNTLNSFLFSASTCSSIGMHSDTSCVWFVKLFGCYVDSLSPWS